MPEPSPKNERWLLLIHQIPPRPGYLRVKIGRRLQHVGAVAIKNTVYALPSGDSPREDFQWVVREIVAGAGDATVCEARFVDGLSDEEVERLFQEARDADYRAIAVDARKLLARLPRATPTEERRAKGEVVLGRLQRRLKQVEAIDFFGAPARTAATRAVAGVERRFLRNRKPDRETTAPRLRPEDYRRRTWVTRRGVHVDRMASAWLVRRFIDPGARFQFVEGKGHTPRPGEVRFDMFEGEFTHDGDCCTFEVLLARMGIEDPALRAIAEIVHDIDLKDRKYEREETAGVERLVAGISLVHRDDEGRLKDAATVLDALYQSFQRKGGGGPIVGGLRAGSRRAGRRHPSSRR